MPILNSIQCFLVVCRVAGYELKQKEQRRKIWNTNILRKLHPLSTKDRQTIYSHLLLKQWVLTSTGTFLIWSLT
jgi:hypothetical protein